MRPTQHVVDVHFSVRSNPEQTKQTSTLRVVDQQTKLNTVKNKVKSPSDKKNLSTKRSKLFLSAAFPDPMSLSATRGSSGLRF